MGKIKDKITDKKPSSNKTADKSKEADKQVAKEARAKRAEQIKICIGILSLVFVLIMLVSFISYFSTWKSDQSLTNYGFFEAMFSSEIQVENYAGKVGALIANFFIRDTFGVASVTFIAILVVISLRLLKIRKIHIFPFLIKSLVIMIWCSIALGSIFRDSLFMVGGKHGFYIFNSLSNLIGSIGTYAVILVSALIIAIFCFDKCLDLVKNSLAKVANFKFNDIKHSLKTDEDDINNADKNQIESNKNIEQEVAESVTAPLEQEPVNQDDNQDVETVQPDETKDNNVIEFDHQPDAKHSKKEKNKNEDIGFDITMAVEQEPVQADITNTETNSQEANTPLIEELDQQVEDILNAEKEPQIEQVAPNNENNAVSTKEVLAENEGSNQELDIEFPEDEELLAQMNLPNYDPTKELEFYKFPSADLLPEFHPKNQLTDEELKVQLNANKDRIVKTLNDYNISISKISATVGPTVTLYEIVPAPGVRISKIKNLEDDIALSLAALGIRIIAPIPGKGTIGIEVPNPNPEMVSMNSVIRSAKFQNSDYDLPVALGKTISNETYVFNLAKTPHLLVAGATGQGKSVGINAIIASLLYKKHPSQLKFVLVDPKMVELSIYKLIEKHFLAKLPGSDNPSIITDVSKVTEAMNSLCILMDERYELLTKAGCRNINEYNDKFVQRKLSPAKGHYYMFYIVVVIDEFADIIVQEGRQVETPISRLAAKARAIGIHLIIATQRPSTNVITGVIKANFPSRIAFKVTNYIDSKTILDQTGANQLIGRGDLLISYNGNVTRVQCAFIDTPEVQKLVDFISEQQSYPLVYELPDAKTEGDSECSSATLDPNNRDDLFEEAARIVCRSQQGSTSLIQRKLSIGYNRAGRIVDQLEAMGILGPYEGSKARQVLYDEVSLEQYLETLRSIK